MADWIKKITKSVSHDLEPGETVRAGLFVQPSGTTGRMVGVQAGGLVGAAIASKLAKKDTAELVTDSGTAATLPAGRALVLGLTDRRLAVWSHGKMSGKPKDLEASVALDAVAGMEVEPRKMTYGVTLVFVDGSGCTFESPKMGGGAEEFAALLNG